MSGHSKWHNIQAKKGKADAARGRIFTKLGREIAVAAKNNPNPDTNSKLADIIAKAKAANMPNDNIMRSIKKAAGEMNGSIIRSWFTKDTAPRVPRLSSRRLRTITTVRQAISARSWESMAVLWAVRAAFPITSTTKAISSWKGL